MASKSSTSWFDDLDWIVKLILVIFLDPIVGGIIRILRGVDQKDNTKLIIGVIFIVTGGLFGIGWIIDIVTMITNKDFTVLA